MKAMNRAAMRLSLLLAVAACGGDKETTDPSTTDAGVSSDVIEADTADAASPGVDAQMPPGDTAAPEPDTDTPAEDTQAPPPTGSVSSGAVYLMCDREPGAGPSGVYHYDASTQTGELLTLDGLDGEDLPADIEFPELDLVKVRLDAMALSPEGSTLVISGRGDGGEQGSLYAYQTADLSAAPVLLFDGATVSWDPGRKLHGVSISPDGSQVSFSAFKEGSFVVPIDGSEAPRSIPGPHETGFNAMGWVSNSVLVYKDNNTLLTIDISQEPLSPVVLSEKAHKPVAGATQFDVDAQGRIYALVRRDKTEDCPNDEPWCLPFIDELTRFNSDGSGAEVVSGAQIVEEQFEHSVHHFSVSPDGKTLAFGTGTIKCPPLVTQVYLLDLEQPGAQASQLTAFDVQPKFAGGSSNCGAGARHITWSPDGKRLVFAGAWRASEAEEQELEALFSVSVDGGDVTRFLYPSEGEVAPHSIKTPWRFAPDAQSLFAIGYIDGNERLIGTSDFESTDQLVKDRVLFEMGCPFVMKP